MDLRENLGAVIPGVRGTAIADHAAITPKPHFIHFPQAHGDGQEKNYRRRSPTKFPWASNNCRWRGIWPAAWVEQLKQGS